MDTMHLFALRWRMLRGKFHEHKKYWDPRRRAIYSKVILTKEQKEAVDRLYLTHYGKKVPYTWHRHYTAFSGKFDATYMPELVYLPEFELYMNSDRNYIHTFSDKNVQPMIAAAAGVTMPRTILSCVEGVLRDQNGRFVSPDEAAAILGDRGDVFCKPSVGSNSGRGCCAAHFEKGTDTLSGSTVGQLLEDMGRNFVIQERLRCHESIRALHPDSVNTLRVMTYRWKNEICHAPIIMRIGQKGNVVDNGHAGGIFIAVDDDGTLHEKAFMEFKQEFTSHPDTHISFAGYQVAGVPKILEAAIRVHQAVPQLGVVNWDFTLDEAGEPVLIEANMKAGSVWSAQMTHGCGPFGERTVEILEWLKFMRKTKNPEKYRFGNGMDT